MRYANFPAHNVLNKYGIRMNRTSFNAFSFTELKAKTTLEQRASGALLILPARTGYWFS